MKEIIFKEENRAKVEKLLDEVQTGARVRTTDYQTIQSMLHEIDRKTNFLSKAAKDGIMVSLDPNAQDFPRAYKGIPMSTMVTAYYHRGSWRITLIKRDICSRKRVKIYLTPAAEASVLDHFKSML